MRYRTEQKSLTGEEWKEKEAKLAKVFNGLDGIKVWQNKYQTFYSKNGVILELYFTSNGFPNKLKSPQWNRMSPSGKSKSW